MGILSGTAFAILSTTNGLKGYSPGQLVFGCDMILPIKHKVDWELICQRKQIQLINIISVKIAKELTPTTKSEND